MDHETLPIILSLPHGGFDAPVELKSCLAIDETDIYNECDLWIDDIINFPDAHVLDKVSTPIARALVDVNRSPDSLTDPDGVVKTETSYQRPTCIRSLTIDEKRALVEKYWTPYHRSLRDALSQHGPSAKLFLDCHNMAQSAPPARRYAGAQRPLICLANLGDHNGAEKIWEISCSEEYIHSAADIARDIFADIELLEPSIGVQPPIVAINLPYSGGYILRQYAQQRRQNDLPPGMMIEFNRGLFVGDQTAYTPVSPPNTERISLVRELTLHWLRQVIQEL